MEGFNIPGKEVNGMDVREVAKESQKAAEHCNEVKNVRKEFKWLHPEFSIPKEVKKQWEEIGKKNNFNGIILESPFTSVLKNQFFLQQRQQQ